MKLDGENWLAGLAFGMLILSGCTAPTAFVRTNHEEYRKKQGPENAAPDCTFSASEKPDTLDSQQRDRLRQQFGGL